MASDEKGKEKVSKADLRERRAYVLDLEITAKEYEVLEAQQDAELREIVHAKEMAHEENRGIFRLYDNITSNTVERLRLRTEHYATAYPDAPLTLILTSPGGTMFDGWVLYDHLRALSNDGHKITTKIRGYAGSMAAVLSQAGDVRVIGPESYLVIHESSTGGWGTATEIEEQGELIRRLTAQAMAVFTRAPSKLTEKIIKKNTTKKDWYLSATECKKYKIVDRVG